MAQPSGADRTVRPFARGDLEPTVATLVRAFDDDPVMQWIFPDPKMRTRRLPVFFAATLRGVGLKQPGTEVVAAADAVLGCAIWMAPGTWRPPLRRQLAGLPSTVVMLGSRLMVAAATFGSLVRVHPSRPHWYLSGIGTDPPAQGTGVGGALMRSRLVRCDAAGEAAYLESSKESNVPFYQQHGFRVTGEVRAPGGGPTLWLMWRDPR